MAALTDISLSYFFSCCVGLGYKENEGVVDIGGLRSWSWPSIYHTGAPWLLRK